MSRKFYFNILFCVGFLILGSRAFALDFTLAADRNNENTFTYGNQYFIGSIYKHYYTILSGNIFTESYGVDYPAISTQWLAFDMVTHNVWNTSPARMSLPSAVSHLVIATRGNMRIAASTPSYLYIPRLEFILGIYPTLLPLGQQSEWKGLFIAGKNFRYYDRDAPEKQNGQECDKSVRNLPHLYFEFAYFYRDKGFGSVFCADGYPDKYFEDDVKYTFVIHSAPHGMAYWIYKDGVPELWSARYFADAWFPRGDDGIDFETATRDPLGATIINMQKVDTQIGIIPVDITNTDWSIEITNLYSGWFY